MLLSKLLSKKNLTLDALPDYGFKLLPELGKTRPVIMGTFKVNKGDYLGVMVNSTVFGHMTIVNLENLSLKIHRNAGEDTCNVTISSFKVEGKLINHPLLKFSNHTVTHNFNRLLSISIGNHFPLYRDLYKDICELTKLQYFRNKYFGGKLIRSVYNNIGFKDKYIPVRRIHTTHLMEAILVECGVLDNTTCYESMYDQYDGESKFIWSQDHSIVRNLEDNNPGTVLYDTLEILGGMRIIEIPNVGTVEKPIWHLPTDNMLVGSYYLGGISAEELSPMVKELFSDLYNYKHLYYQGRIQIMEGFLVFQTIDRLIGKYNLGYKVSIESISKTKPLPTHFTSNGVKKRQMMISISM